MFKKNKVYGTWKRGKNVYIISFMLQHTHHHLPVYLSQRYSLISFDKFISDLLKVDINSITILGIVRVYYEKNRIKK